MSRFCEFNVSHVFYEVHLITFTPLLYLFSLSGQLRFFWQHYIAGSPPDNRINVYIELYIFFPEQISEWPTSQVLPLDFLKV